jgi:methyl-accepting chemotaxis protein
MTRVATAFRELAGQSEKVGTLVEQVGLGSAEQARDIQQIAKAITQIEQITQHAAATAEENASAAEELSAQSHALRTAVERLTDLIGGSK